MKTLILYAHPAQQHSRINRALAETARQVAGVTFVDLYAEYPRKGLGRFRLERVALIRFHILRL